MNTKKIWVIIITMTIALVGVIMVQLFWIDNAIKVRHEQFVNKVNDAMNCVVNKLETQEAFTAITKQIPPIAYDTTTVDNKYLDPVPDLISPFFDGMMIPDIGINDSEINISLRKHPMMKNGDAHFHFTDSTIVEGINNNKKKVIHSINDSVQYYLKQSMSIVNSKMNKLSEVMQKMASEFLQGDDNIAHRINKEHLEKLIQSEMVDHNLHSKCIYGIVNEKENKVILSQEENENENKNLLESNYKVQLFPNDIFLHPDYLVLYFPGSKTWVIRRLWGMMLLSLLFTLIIIIAFTYTIFIIFKQKKISDIKTDFINNMTHEFKTPIATISLAVDSIKNPKVYENKEKIQYFAGIIKEENNRMNLQVEQVLKIALLDRGTIKLNLEKTDVHELISKAVEKINLQVEQRNGTIIQKMEATEHLIMADAVHLTNMIFNLLDNANKYSPHHPEIVIATRNINKGICIVVIDKGIGMSKDIQKKIFEKFYRVPTGNLHDVKGFGLGLSYVKLLVEAHKGSISVHSELNEGSTFEIFLPIEQ